MPQFILATAAFILRRQGSPEEATAHEALHATTRTRAATRRLWASRMHEPYVDPNPLRLSTRH
jgi:hypothetical protein